MAAGSCSQRTRKSAGRLAQSALKSPPPKMQLSPTSPYLWQARQPRDKTSFSPSSSEGLGFSSPLDFLLDLVSDFFFSSLASFGSLFLDSTLAGSRNSHAAIAWDSC